MKAQRLAGLAMTLASLGVIARWTLATAQQVPPEWRTSYSSALEEARRTGKPLFVVIR